MTAAARFKQRLSWPFGDTRRASTMGDSHPSTDGARIMDVPADELRAYATEELPGYGVVFTNNPGTPKETYLAFKSGPNRGHFHGDQLAYHFCANGNPLLVDHHCSYHPRAGQEHMHNRLAFFTDEFPYANMDGYERLIAFKTGAVADVAVGQVESSRLRKVQQFPPEDWDARYPELRFDRPLVYRRTVVCVKGGAQDYVVFRDQFWADRPLHAAYCLHTYGDAPTRDAGRVSFGPKLTLFCATPTEFALKPFPWSHDNGKHEETQGARLEMTGQAGEFITVVYPDGATPPMAAIAGGVEVGDDRIVFGGNQTTDGKADTVVRVTRGGKDALTLAGTDINLSRNQGRIGLFVPDAGYPFGDIPDWLIKQRAAPPAWYTPWPALGELVP
jgi:hypothetical protein